LPKAPEKCFDHLGRVKSIDGKKLTLTNVPIYAVFDEKTRFDLIAPPKPAKLVPGKPGELVLQALPPEQSVDFKKSAYKIASGRTNEIPIFLYNFGTKTLRGKLRVNVPKNWSAKFISQTEIAPGERKELRLNLVSPKNTNWSGVSVKITGNFSSTEKPMLSMQLISE